jgi:hypothetical protein
MDFTWIGCFRGSSYWIGQPLCSGFAFFIYKKLYFDAADVFQKKKNHVIIPIEFNKWILFYLENKKNEFFFFFCKKTL